MEYEVKLTLEGNKIRIQSNHPDYLSDMIDEFAIHIKNYYFQPKYKAGIWNGKINFISMKGLMSYGLLLEFLRASKKLYPTIKIKANDDVKNLFKGLEIKPIYDLKHFPYPYQKESIETCLQKTKGIIKSSTASGKSLVITYIIKELLRNRKITGVTKCLLVVPSQSLVEQFKSDMISYGIQEELIGKIYTGFKEWDKHIVISTWQSLSSNHNKLQLFQAIIIDETHKAKSIEIKKILSKSKCNYRFGFTGTLNIHKTDLYNTIAFLGPVLKEYNSGFLAKEGYISKCNVKRIIIEYNNIESKTYQSIKEEIFNKQKRFKLIEKVISETNDNILLLVSKIDEGEKLEKLVNRKIKNKTAIFLSGRDKVNIREEWRQRMMKEKNIVIIATYGIFECGVNIPNLKYLVLASPIKSKIRTLQSIGRSLRLHETKQKDGAIIYDIVDEVKYLSKHAKKRLEYYESEGFNVEEY